MEKKSFERFMNPKKMNFYLLGKLQTHQLMSLLFFSLKKKQTSFVLEKRGIFLEFLTVFMGFVKAMHVRLPSLSCISLYE